MAVSEMKEMSGVKTGETPAKQLKLSRIARDNRDTTLFREMVNNTCNPFSDSVPTQLVNIATGRVASQNTSDYLTNSLIRGSTLKQNFVSECIDDSERFQKTIRRVKIQNFAAENVKTKQTGDKKSLSAADSVRDSFAHVLARQDPCDLKVLLAYPITEIPLSLAHTDGTPTKTEKSNLARLLEKKQDCM